MELYLARNMHVECIARGHILLFFSEYYLAIRDSRVADLLTHMYPKSLEGQMPYGGWGHKLMVNEPDSVFGSGV
jgi:hypothetical protein